MPAAAVGEDGVRPEDCAEEPEGEVQLPGREREVRRDGERDAEVGVECAALGWGVEVGDGGGEGGRGGDAVACAAGGEDGGGGRGTGDERGVGRRRGRGGR